MDKSASPKNLSIPYIKELDQLSPDEIEKILDDRGARQTIDVLNWPEQYSYRPLTIFATAHTDTTLYIDFFVRCNYLRAVNYANNSNVHQDSCVEFFVQPHLDKQEYMNFEFNCIGTIHSARRIDRHNGTPRTDEELARVLRYPSVGTRPFQEVQGLITWSILVAIPLDLMDIRYEGKPVHMRGNFYKCADLTSAPHFLSWNPINTPEPDFHRPEFFGNITLE